MYCAWDKTTKLIVGLGRQDILEVYPLCYLQKRPGQAVGALQDSRLGIGTRDAAVAGRLGFKRPQRPLKLKQISRLAL
jgi:hypothetical protein